MGPTIYRLRSDWDGVKESELERLFRRVPHLDDRQRALIRQSFARLLGKFVREEKLITLQEAVRRLTSFPASKVCGPGSSCFSVAPITCTTLPEPVISRVTSNCSCPKRTDTASVAGSVTLSGTTATFTPSAPLAYSTTYTATLTTGVTDLANNALAAAYTWSFTTGAAPSLQGIAAGPDGALWFTDGWTIFRVSTAGVIDCVDAGQNRGEEFITAKFYANLLDYTTDEKSDQVVYLLWS